MSENRGIDSSGHLCKCGCGRDSRQRKGRWYGHCDGHKKNPPLPENRADISTCACGCGRKVKRCRYYKGHAPVDSIGDAPLCLCGCGSVVTWDSKNHRWNKYLKYHSSNMTLYNDHYIEKTNGLGRLCACGCGQLVYNQNGSYLNYVKNHKKYPIPNEPAPKCNCGCDGDVLWSYSCHGWNTYIHGHCDISEEYRNRLSVAQKKHYEDHPERKDNHSKRMIEIYKDHPELKIAASDRMINRYDDPAYGISMGAKISQAYKDNPALGEHSSMVHRKRYEDPIARLNTGLAVKNAYTTKPELRENIRRLHQTPEWKEYTSKRMRLLWKNNEYKEKILLLRNTPEYRDMQRRHFLRLWETKEYSDRMCNSWNKRPNYPERLINCLTPDCVQYVGNGKYHQQIELHLSDGTIRTINKNPDFIVTNNKGGVVGAMEFNGMRWHEKDPPDEVFTDAWARVGIRLLIIWSHEMKNIPAMLNRISMFIGQEQWQMQLPM